MKGVRKFISIWFTLHVLKFVYFKLNKVLQNNVHCNL
jgi:hypothetical protein